MSTRILVIGAVNIDLNIRSTTPYILHDSNVVTHLKQVGGVGANIAQNLAHLGLDVSFLTVFSIDALGHFARQSLERQQIDISAADIRSITSNIYMAIFDQEGDLYLGLNDMPLVQEMTPDWISTKDAYIDTFDALVLDNNLPQETIEYVVKTFSTKRIYIDAVSGVKAPKLVNIINDITVLKMNQQEYNILFTTKKHPETTSLLVTNGAQKITLFNADKELTTQPLAVPKPSSTSGAGDALFSGFIAGQELGYSTSKALQLGAFCAYKTILVPSSINHEVTIDEFIHRTK